MVIYTKLEIDGTETDVALDISMNKATSKFNGTSSMTAVFDNVAGLNKDLFTNGDEVILYADNFNPPTTKIFGGKITEVNFKGQGIAEKMTLSARDFASELQNIEIDIEVYTNREVSFMVNDLMTKYAPVGFTTTNVEVTSTTLSRLVFKAKNLFDALIQLAELTENADWLFWVDEDKDLHFTKMNQVSSGVTLNNTNVLTSTFKELIDDVKNKVTVYGTRILVSNGAQTIVADGVGSVFQLNGNPHNTDIVVDGVHQDGAILFANQEPTSGTNYMVNFYDAQIVFASGTALGYSSIPASGASVVANYDVSRPIIKVQQDVTSVNAYGLRTETVTDENIEDPQMASSVAKSQLALKKDPLTQGNLGLQGVYNLVPGQTVVVDLPNKNIDLQTQDIVSCKYNFNTDNNFHEEVLKVVTSEKIGDITDVLKELILNFKQLNIMTVDQAAVVPKLFQYIGSVGVTVPTYHVSSRTLNDSFTLDHPQNGVLGVVGSPNTGSITGATWVSGIIGTGWDKALSFDGVNNVVDLGNVLDLPGQAITISAWINPSNLGSTFNTIFDKGNTGGDGYIFRIRNSPQLEFRFNGITSTCPYTFSSGTWYHTVATYNGSNVEFYVNGSNENTVARTDSILTSSDNAYIGGRAGTLDNWPGKIDDLRIYNRALSGTEIGSLFEKKNYPTNNLDAYYKFDTGSGTNAYSSASGGSYKLQPIIGDRRGTPVVIGS